MFSLLLSKENVNLIRLITSKQIKLTTFICLTRTSNPD